MLSATCRPDGRFRGANARRKTGTDRGFLCKDGGMAEPTVEARETRVQQEEADFARLVRSGARMPGDQAPADYRRLLRPALWVVVAGCIPVGAIVGLIVGMVNEPGNHDYIGRGVVPAFFAVVGAAVGAAFAAFGGLALLLTRPKG